MALLLETHWGDLVIDLDYEGSPALVKNVLKLAKARFYTSTLIHNVLPNRFCQLGCPVGDGSGGTSIYGLLDDSSTDYSKSSKRFLKETGRVLTAAECSEKGRVVACCTNLAVSDTIGSQFWITTAEGTDRALDGFHLNSSGGSSSSSSKNYLSLGVVTEDSNNVLDKLNAVHVDKDGRPFADIRIIRALVIHDPFEDDDPPGLSDYMERHQITRDSSPSPLKPSEEVAENRISVAELDDEEDNDEETLKRRHMESLRRDDKSRAVVLEMLGDLPSADMKAPENVLFVCKLNPITLAEDLQLIFSRFDPNVQVEIIRDAETGQSLQYAFCEFQTQQQAAEAYFKMNNALIDDRRIKVDFSQSVAKLWDKYHQRMRMPALEKGRQPSSSRKNQQHSNTHNHRNNNNDDNNNDRRRGGRDRRAPQPPRQRGNNDNHHDEFGRTRIPPRRLSPPPPYDEGSAKRQHRRPEDHTSGAGGDAKDVRREDRHPGHHKQRQRSFSRSRSRDRHDRHSSSRRHQRDDDEDYHRGDDRRRGGRQKRSRRHQDYDDRRSRDRHRGDNDDNEEQHGEKVRRQRHETTERHHYHDDDDGEHERRRKRHRHDGNDDDDDDDYYDRERDRRHRTKRRHRHRDREDRRDKDDHHRRRRRSSSKHERDEERRGRKRSRRRSRSRS